MIRFKESRRHRLNPNDTPLVRSLVLEKLWHLLDEKNNPEVAEELFRIAWRMDHNTVGKPSYPEFSWEMLDDWLKAHEDNDVR